MFLWYKLIPTSEFNPSTTIFFLGGAVSYDFLRCVVIWNINEFVNDFPILPASDIIWYFYFPSEWLLLIRLSLCKWQMSANDIISFFHAESHSTVEMPASPVSTRLCLCGFSHSRSFWSCVLVQYTPWCPGFSDQAFSVYVHRSGTVAS